MYILSETTLYNMMEKQDFICIPDELFLSVAAEFFTQQMQNLTEDLVLIIV